MYYCEQGYPDLFWCVWCTGTETCQDNLVENTSYINCAFVGTISVKDCTVHFMPKQMVQSHNVHFTGAFGRRNNTLTLMLLILSYPSLTVSM
jgi:hypothetical protein